MRLVFAGALLWAASGEEERSESCPRLVLLASKPFTGSHLTRRLIESATGVCTYSVYPEGVRSGGDTSAAAYHLDRYQTTLSLSLDNERYRAKMGFGPCAESRCDYLVKTHNDATTKPASDLAKAFRRVRVFRLVRNPFDAIMRALLGDARQMARAVAARGDASSPARSAAAAKATAERAARLAMFSKGHAKYHRFWAGYARDQLVARYEALCLDTAGTMDAVLRWIFDDDVGPSVDAARLAVAVEAEATLVADRAGQIGKESVRVMDRAWKDDGRPVFGPETFKTIATDNGKLLDDYGYAPLLETFASIVLGGAGGRNASAIDARPARLLAAPRPAAFRVL